MNLRFVHPPVKNLLLIASLPAQPDWPNLKGQFGK